MEKCPFCAEEIQEEAIKCKHCGSDLKQQSGPSITPPQAIAKPSLQKNARETTRVEATRTGLSSITWVFIGLLFLFLGPIFSGLFPTFCLIPNLVIVALSSAFLFHAGFRNLFKIAPEKQRKHKIVAVTALIMFSLFTVISVISGYDDYKQAEELAKKQNKENEEKKKAEDERRMAEKEKQEIQSKINEELRKTIFLTVKDKSVKKSVEVITKPTPMVEWSTKNLKKRIGYALSGLEDFRDRDLEALYSLGLHPQTVYGMNDKELIEFMCRAAQSGDIGQQHALEGLGFSLSELKKSQQRRTSERLVLKCVYQNSSARDVKEFQGQLLIHDLSGQFLNELSVKISTLIKTGKEARWEYKTELNQGNERDQIFKNTDLQNMRIDWVPQMVTFADGTILGGSSR